MVDFFFFGGGGGWGGEKGKRRVFSLDPEWNSWCMQASIYAYFEFR